MRYLVELSSPPGQPENTFLYFIKLFPGTPEEKNLLEESGNNDRIELYYHEAVNQHLGDDFSLVRVQDDRGWPYASLVLVEKTTGIG